MKIFVLEDLPDRQEAFKRKFEDDEVIVASNNKDAIEILKKEKFDLICLDHDLAGGVFVDVNSEQSGCRTAEFLKSINYTGKIIIHSWNPGGAKHMKEKFLPHAELRPTYWEGTKGKHVIDVSRGDKLLSEYLKDKAIKRVLLSFFHGLGDLIQGIQVFKKLRTIYPDVHFDLGLCKGLGEEEVYPEAILLNPDWREKFKDLGYDLVFSWNFPMSEHQTKYTKGEWSCIKELGIEPTCGHYKPEIIKNRLVGIHQFITCLPDLANVPYEVSKKVWNEVKDAGFIPISTHFCHVFNNPENKQYDFVNRHVRDIKPQISTLAGLIQSCGYFICSVSGPFHVALTLLPPERICLMEKEFSALSFTRLPIKRVDIKKYKDNIIKDWLLSF